MISALGAMNGLLFAGSRVCSALGKEHRVFAELGRWNTTLGSPVWSLLALAAISIAMIVSVGTKAGRDAIDSVLIQCRIGNIWFDFSESSIKALEEQGVPKDVLSQLPALHEKPFPSEDAFFREAPPLRIPGYDPGVDFKAETKIFKEKLLAFRKGPMPWEKYFGGFDTLFAGTAPVFWLFFLFTGLALFVLRENDKETERSFKVPFYPYLPSIFCAMCIFGLYSALKYAELVSLIGIVPMLIGVPLYALSRLRGRMEEELLAPAPEEAAPPQEPAAEPGDDRIQTAPDARNNE
jgi:amino acid transporter